MIIVLFQMRYGICRSGPARLETLRHFVVAKSWREIEARRSGNLCFSCQSRLRYHALPEASTHAHIDLLSYFCLGVFDESF